MKENLILAYPSKKIGTVEIIIEGESQKKKI
jgi:hypothetical protein